MKKILMSGVAAIALGAMTLPAHADDKAAVAATECEKKLDKLRTDLSGDKAFSETYRAGLAASRDYMLLRQAAMTFARKGMNERCEDVVEGMRELAKQQSDEFGRRDRTADEKDRKTREERRMAELKAAKPVAEASVSIKNIMGKDVRNLRDVDLGDVEDVVTASGTIKNVIIARGGFLGLGVTYYQVAWSDLKITQDNETVVLAVSEKALEAMPTVEKQDGRWVAEGANPKKDKAMDDKKKSE